MPATIMSRPNRPLQFRCVRCRRSHRAPAKPLRLHGCSRAAWPRCCQRDTVLVLSATTRRLEDTTVIPALAGK